jgi:cell filamentation protein
MPHYGSKRRPTSRGSGSRVCCARRSTVGTTCGTFVRSIDSSSRGFYEWAGEVRTVDISLTAPFCKARFIEAAAHETFARLAPDLAAAETRDAFVDRLATHFGNVNALHPFREGNGRTQRAFFAQLAAHTGYVIDWSAADRDENVAASRASLSGDYERLRRLLDEITVAATG